MEIKIKAAFSCGNISGRMFCSLLNLGNISYLHDKYDVKNRYLKEEYLSFVIGNIVNRVLKV